MNIRLPLALAIVALTTLSHLSIAAQSRAPSALDRQLIEILQLLPGRYAGEAGNPRIALQHKIVQIEAPQFGELVFYHQISRDGMDSTTPFQQKIYVFDRRTDRAVNRMRSFVFPPKSGYANLERQPDVLKTLDPAKLMNFPEGCAFLWSALEGEPGAYVARVSPETCAYESAAFKQRISPKMTYRVANDSFGIEDLLYGATGQPLFPPSGLLVVPRLVEGTTTAVLAASMTSDWRRLDPERTLYLELESGRVIFELAPTFAPEHVRNIRALSQSGWFDGLSINRVQDNFVTQWGDPDGSRPITTARSRVSPEFERLWTPSIAFTPLSDGDVYAPKVGFVEGMPAAGEGPGGALWLAHCYGTLGVGRDNAPDSGSGAELYAVIGHAPRQLDRNITVVGRAVLGMEHLAALPRGTEALGFYKSAAERVPIRRIRMAADLPPAERIELEALRTDTATFAALVEARRNRRDAWYFVPAGRIDLCSVPLPVRVAR